MSFDWIAPWLLALAGLAAVAGVVFFACRYTFWRPKRPEAWPRVLMYHEIGQKVPEGMAPDLCVTREAFQGQIHHLASHGYTFLHVSELSRASEVKKPVVITFDDGFSGNVENALPILQGYGAKATIFVACSSDISAAPMLTAAQLQELADEPLIELGAHTAHHINLTRHDAPTVEKEIRESMDYVESFIGKPCVSFAYPYGRFEEKDIGILKKLGIRFAVTTKKNIQPFGDPYRINRSTVPRSCSLLQFKILLRSGRYKV